MASGLMGSISGSSIANIVTTGTFTIPLMKKVGYPAKKAAAIEVAASTDGQLMPPEDVSTRDRCRGLRQN